MIMRLLNFSNQLAPINISIINSGNVINTTVLETKKQRLDDENSAHDRKIYEGIFIPKPLPIGTIKD